MSSRRRLQQIQCSKEILIKIEEDPKDPAKSVPRRVPVRFIMESNAPTVLIFLIEFEKLLI